MNVTFKMYLPLSRNITSLAFNYFVHGNNVKNVCSDNNISYEIWEHHEMMSASLVDAALMIRRKSVFFQAYIVLTPSNYCLYNNKLSKTNKHKNREFSSLNVSHDPIYRRTDMAGVTFTVAQTNIR